MHKNEGGSYNHIRVLMILSSVEWPDLDILNFFENWAVCLEAIRAIASRGQDCIISVNEVDSEFIQTEMRTQLSLIVDSLRWCSDIYRKELELLKWWIHKKRGLGVWIKGTKFVWGPRLWSVAHVSHIRGAVICLDNGQGSTSIITKSVESGKC